MAPRQAENQAVVGIRVQNQVYSIWQKICRTRENEIQRNQKIYPI